MFLRLAVFEEDEENGNVILAFVIVLTYFSSNELNDCVFVNLKRFCLELNFYVEATELLSEIPLDKPYIS